MKSLRSAGIRLAAGFLGAGFVLGCPPEDSTPDGGSDGAAIQEGGTEACSCADEDAGPHGALEDGNASDEQSDAAGALTDASSSPDATLPDGAGQDVREVFLRVHADQVARRDHRVRDRRALRPRLNRGKRRGRASRPSH
jgi:hypothetical protein